MKAKFPLDKNTFGSEKAAIVLAEILSEIGSTKLLSNTSAYLSELNATLRQVQYIPDAGARLTVYNLIYDSVKNRRYNNTPPRAETYTRNVALTKVKQYRDIDVAIIRQEKSADARERSLLRNLSNQ